MGKFTIKFIGHGLELGMLVALLVGSNGGSAASPLLAISASQYRELGLQYRQQERFSDAIAAFQKAVELDPKNPSGRVLLGWTLHLAGQDRAAANVLQQTVYADPYDVPNLNALGIIYLVNDDLAAAVIAHTWAATLAPDNEIAYYNLSLAFQRLGHYERAIATAQKAADLEPNNPHPLVALAIAHWDKGEAAIAQQVYQRAIALDPRYRGSNFLNQLDDAGFSPAQIEKSRQVLNALQ